MIASCSCGQPKRVLFCSFLSLEVCSCTAMHQNLLRTKNHARVTWAEKSQSKHALAPRNHVHNWLWRLRLSEMRYTRPWTHCLPSWGKDGSALVRNSNTQSHTWQFALWGELLPFSDPTKAKTSSPQLGHAPFTATKSFFHKPRSALAEADAIGQPIAEPSSMNSAQVNMPRNSIVVEWLLSSVAVLNASW